MAAGAGGAAGAVDQPDGACAAESQRRQRPVHRRNRFNKSLHGKCKDSICASAEWTHFVQSGSIFAAVSYLPKQHLVEAVAELEIVAAIDHAVAVEVEERLVAAAGGFVEGVAEGQV